MEGLKLVPYIALVIAISGIVLGAAVITLSKFGETMDTCHNSSFFYNSTVDKCEATEVAGNYTTGGRGANFSSEYFTVDKGVEGLITVAEQQPTVAIIAIMVIIISILAGVFVYMRYFA